MKNLFIPVMIILFFFFPTSIPGNPSENNNISHKDNVDYHKLSDMNMEKEEDHHDEDDHNHDPYLMDKIITQPWRHPEKIMEDLVLKRISPILGVFILSLIIRPFINRLIRKAGE